MDYDEGNMILSKNCFSLSFFVMISSTKRHPFITMSASFIRLKAMDKVNIRFKLLQLWTSSFVRFLKSKIPRGCLFHTCLSFGRSINCNLYNYDISPVCLSSVIFSPSRSNISSVESHFSVTISLKLFKTFRRFDDIAFVKSSHFSSCSLRKLQKKSK